MSQTLTCYNIEGRWKLKQLESIDLDDDYGSEQENTPTFLTVSQRVINSHFVQEILNFEVGNCKVPRKLVYRADINQNFLWVINSEDVQSDQQLHQNQDESALRSECSQEELKRIEDVAEQIDQQLENVFTFEINQSQMRFLSPTRKQLFAFAHSNLKSQNGSQESVNIVGEWLLDSIYWERANFERVRIFANNTARIDFLCGSNYLEMDCFTRNVDQIEFSNIQEKARGNQTQLQCSVSDEQALNSVKNAFSEARYFRRKGLLQLQLYDQGPIEIVELAYNGKIIR